MVKLQHVLPLICLTSSCQSPSKAPDPELWLEEVDSTRSLEYVKQASQESLQYLQKNSRYHKTLEQSRKILNTPDKLPNIRLREGHIYNFWETEENLKGVWRRIPLQDFKAAKENWEILLDVGALAKKEKKNWVWQGADVNLQAPQKVLISLSDGGSDASEIREFDLSTKSFVKEGFFLPLSKGHLSWKDANHVYASPALHPDDVTSSGYPRTVRVVKRGEDLYHSTPILEAATEDMSAHARLIERPEGLYTILAQALNFYQTNVWIQNSQGEKFKVPFQDARLTGIFKEQALLLLQSSFQNIQAGSLVAIPLNKLEKVDLGESDMEILFSPTREDSLKYPVITKNHVLLVVNRSTLPYLYRVKAPAKSAADFSLSQNLEKIAAPQNLLISGVTTEKRSDRILVYSQDILTPTKISLYDVQKNHPAPEILFELKGLFDSKDYHYTRHEVASEDGTMIPYFVVSKKDLKRDGTHPTLLYGYGGFKVSLSPDTYSPLLGKTWLENGGVYVIANIRGGGEFGPEWHKSAIKFNKLKSYEDFAAVARDLVTQKITKTDKLALYGGSNGGLLVGATMVRYPEIAKAVIAEVPLLDMLRYHKLLSGASWMAEYGNPDNPQEAAYIRQYSPYQNVKSDVHYPSVLFTTSTRDDRVHPGHARKMYKKMKDQGHDVYLYENLDGGHGRAADLEKKALLNTIKMSFLFEKLQM